MKNSFLTVLFIFCAGSILGQRQPESVQNKQLLYFEATESKSWDIVLDMINPKIFKLTPRVKIEQIYRQMDNKTSMLIHFRNMKILNFLPELVVSDTSYIPVDYSQELHIQVNPGIYKTKKQLRILQEGFQLSYLGQGIKFDPKKYQFILESRNTIIWSSPVGKEFWTFWEYRPNDPMLKVILPLDVVNRLGSGWSVD